MNDYSNLNKKSMIFYINIFLSFDYQIILEGWGDLVLSTNHNFTFLLESAKNKLLNNQFSNFILLENWTC